METTVPIITVVAAVFLLALGAVADDRRARIRRRGDAEPEVEPPLLHSINDDRCIGCEACIDVCPTEVLDLVDHKVQVARFSDCVQCEQCANVCPTTALVMYRQGAVPRTLTVPELDDHFQTAVPGQYLIGEIAGKPLVKNAANLGRAVIEHISRDLKSRPAAGGAGVVDVVIVGSGPGGLSAGLTCIRTGLSCVVLEKEHVLSSTVSRYPKGKHFMAEPSTAINVSYLPVFDASKEVLVAAWQRVVDGAKLPIKLGEAVETVQRGDDGVFTVKTTVATYRARAVVLATGLRGKPRLLAVPGANLEKVQSLLDDPAEFANTHVLVVGGGDSAVEGAMALADLGATVTLSYRADGFKRCKQGNQKRLAEMTAAGTLSVLLESNVKEFTADEVTIKLKDGSSSTIPNQHAFVLIGADTPVVWLEANNVRFVEREHLYALGSTEDVVRKVVPEATECPKDPDEALALVLGKARSHRRLRSVVEHIHDEFREVVTSVTGVFRMPNLEGKPETRTGLKPYAPQQTRSGTKSHGTQVGIRAVPARPVPPKLIPTANLKPRLVAPAPKLFPSNRAPTNNPFAPERTVVIAPFGSAAPARSRPPSPKRVPPPTRVASRVGDTSEDTMSLPARLLARSLGRTVVTHARQPVAPHTRQPVAPDPDADPDTVLRADPDTVVHGDTIIETAHVTNDTGETVALPVRPATRQFARPPTPTRIDATTYKPKRSATFGGPSRDPFATEPMSTTSAPPYAGSPALRVAQGKSGRKGNE